MSMTEATTFEQVVLEHIQEKRAIGCGFDKEAQVLKRIVALQDGVDHGSPCLSRELADQWIRKTPWENETNRCHRISILRGLSSFMARLGYETVSVPRRISPWNAPAYSPTIFSERELGALLAAVDRLCERCAAPNSAFVFPVVFRILVGCGTRIFETLRIEKRDLDLEKGAILLRFTKNDKERIIPVAPSIIARMIDYLDQAQRSHGFDGSPFLFPNKEGTAYNAGTAYTFFRKALHTAGISHGGRGKGPRLHDLRHTYAVRVLNKWVRDGRNLNAALPYLAAYMGHSDLRASERYLRLTVSMFPDLIRKAEDSFGWVIPEANHG